MELDKLLRAFAYILGASGYTILYKAILEDGLTFAVRRLGDGGLEKYKDFEAEAKAICRVKHPNIVRLRAFYWGIEEKLLVYDHIPHGSMANAYYGEFSCSLFSISCISAGNRVQFVFAWLFFIYFYKASPSIACIL